MTRTRISRRAMTSAILGALAGPQVASAQGSPEGTITVEDETATFSVDYPRPLESVVFTLNRRYGWLITYEEAPLVYSTDIVDVTKNEAAGIRALIPRGGRLQFRYELGSGGAPPQDPVPVVEAALVALRREGLPGRYRVIRDEDRIHIAPTGFLDERGVVRTYESPLDSLVTVEGGGREPGPLLVELVEQVNAEAEFPIALGRHPFFRGDQPSVLQNFQRVTARSLVRRLGDLSTRPRIWYMLFYIRKRQYILSIV